MLRAFAKSCHSVSAYRRFISTTSALRKAQFYETAEEALSDVKDGATIVSGGFCLVGIPENCYTALKKLGPKNLTIVSITTGATGFGVEQAIAAGQVKKITCAYISLNPVAREKYLKGELEIELCPMGTIAERIRAGGSGIPAFYTATGVGTLVQTGGIPLKFKPNGEVESYNQPKPVAEFDGRKYILEKAIKGDFAFIKAWKADRKGNLVCRKSARNCNPDMAKAGKIVIAEVEEIVETGELDPELIQIPHIYVNRVFKGKDYKKKFLLDNMANPKPAGSKPKSKAELLKERIVRRVALELKDGVSYNLGIGIPTLAADFCKPNHDASFQAELGILGTGRAPQTKAELDLDLQTAGLEPTSILPGASFFSISESFAMIRGGHVDWTILGALQVAKNGDLANWKGPGNDYKGIGGAMDLVSTAGLPEGTKVMVAMQHAAKGVPKILNECTLPLTGKGVVDMIVTEMGVFMVDRKNSVLTLTEIAEDCTIDQVKAATGCEFKVAHNLKLMGQAENVKA